MSEKMLNRKKYAALKMAIISQQNVKKVSTT